MVSAKIYSRPNFPLFHPSRFRHTRFFWHGGPSSLGDLQIERAITVDASVPGGAEGASRSVVSFVGTHSSTIYDFE